MAFLYNFAVADAPLLITAVAIWAYWLSVLIMGVRRRLSAQGASGLAPAERREQMMWLLWVPVIAAWIALPALATKDHWLLQLPAWAHENAAIYITRWAAASTAALCYCLTVVCWIVMGRNWSVAVVHDDQQLVTNGPFRFVRHPIYSLSILLMACTIIVLPTLPLAMTAALHIVLLNLKARGEERHLLAKYGEQYRAYMKSAGRFVPKLSK